MVVARAPAAANSLAMRAMSAAGTVLVFSAHSGVYFSSTAQISSSVQFAHSRKNVSSASFSFTMTCAIASATAPSVPGFGMKNSSEFPAVFDMRTSKVTSFAPPGSSSRSAPPKRPR